MSVNTQHLYVNLFNIGTNWIGLLCDLSTTDVKRHLMCMQDADTITDVALLMLLDIKNPSLILCLVIIFH